MKKMSFTKLNSFVKQISYIINRKYQPSKNGRINLTPLNISELKDLFREN
jgi:hypothetical protein